MADFKAKIRPELHPAAQELVRIYESVPGSTGPGCCPEALAAVLDHICNADRDSHEHWNGQAITFVHVADLRHYAALLRGEQP